MERAQQEWTAAYGGVSSRNGTSNLRCTFTLLNTFGILGMAAMARRANEDKVVSRKGRLEKSKKTRGQLQGDGLLGNGSWVELKCRVNVVVVTQWKMPKVENRL